MPSKKEYELDKQYYKQEAINWEKNNRSKRNEIVKRYKRTLKGMILDRFKEMRCRVEGKRPKGKHRYEGLPICEKEDFLNWSLSSLELLNLYNQWVKSDYKRSLSPSVDRINSSDGYLLNNIRWITQSENSSLGGKNKNG